MTLYIDQIKQTLSAHGIDFDAVIERLGTVQKSRERCKGRIFSLPEHIRAMVYSLLSSQRPWGPIQRNQSQIDEIFGHFDPIYLNMQTPQVLVRKIREIKCGNRNIQKQMSVLHANIAVLRRIERDHGSLDRYVESSDPISIAQQLSAPGSKFKLQQMGFALSMEYLRHVGIEAVKPDVHIRRLMGPDRLGLVDANVSDIELAQCLMDIARQKNISAIYLDNLCWQFCATNYGNICTATPKCEQCLVTSCAKFSLPIESESVPLADAIAWAKEQAPRVIETCRIEAIDGMALFTPDGEGHYGALWTRDFAYLVEHGGHLLAQAETRAAIQVLLDAQRKDGAVPDRVNQRLVPIYFPGPVDKPMGAHPALDNPLFLVSLVYHYHRRFGDPAFISQVLPVLERGLEWLPFHHGLIFNDAQMPACTYGFQDTVAKGGHDLFTSLLYVVACYQMAELSRDMQWQERAKQTEANLWLLWDDTNGYYLAADEVCRQFDVWGNAFAVAHGIGDLVRRQRIAQTLVDCYEEIIYEGQVRHLPAPETWERTFIPVDAGTYQNGGYWGTASGWFIKAVRTVDPALAQRTYEDLLRSYHQNGILEWIAPDGCHGPGLYVATIMNVLTLIEEHHK